MIGKIMKRTSFYGCVRYVVSKEGARVLDADGIIVGTVREMAADFEFQRQQNPGISKPVGHIALSFKPEDKKKLTDGMMATIAREYMELMGIKDTQFLLVRHTDNDNPHCHIVFNRIGYNGKTISDKNDFRRNEKVCKQLKDKYGLTYATGKNHTRAERLRGKDKVKYEVYLAVKDALRHAVTWSQFRKELHRRGVELDFAMRAKGSRRIADIQGLNFTKDGVTFKASQIDRSFSYSRLSGRLTWTSQTEDQQPTNKPERTTSETSTVSFHTNTMANDVSYGSLSFPSLGLFNTDNPAIDPAEEEFRRRMQRRKKRRGPRL